MKCKHVRKRLLSFSDRELSKREGDAIQIHLENCRACSQQFDILATLFDNAGAFKKIKPSPFLWGKLASRIAQNDKSRTSISRMFEIAKSYAPAFALLALIPMGIFAGIHLGSLPDLPVTDATSQKVHQVEESLLEFSYLDSFKALPPQSIGGMYLSMISQKE